MLLDVKWGYIPINPYIENVLSKMLLIHLIWTLQLSLADLKCAQNSSIGGQLGKSSNTKTFIMKHWLYRVIYYVYCFCTIENHHNSGTIYFPLNIQTVVTYCVTILLSQELQTHLYNCLPSLSRVSSSKAKLVFPLSRAYSFYFSFDWYHPPIHLSQRPPSSEAPHSFIPYLLNNQDLPPPSP